MIGSFGNVLSGDIKWKRTRWTASPWSLCPVTQVQIDGRTWLVFANTINILGNRIQQHAFAIDLLINTRTNEVLYVDLPLKLGAA